MALRAGFPGIVYLLEFRIHTDTSDFLRLKFDDVLLLDGKPYLVRHNATENRFGLVEEQIFWVKRALDLETGKLKLVKLVFHERFMARVGDIAFECFRSPEKESRILRLVRGHKNFMKGYGIEDERGNLVRILDYIKGEPLANYVEEMAIDHKTYFGEQFPGILDQFVESIEAVRFLHDHGEKHGDIRRDHILIDPDTGVYRWIDFDCNYRHRENIYGYDLFGLGNILSFLVGKGDVVIKELREKKHPAMEKLNEGDLNIIFRNRVVNLKKVYPYIPDSLNRILLCFSAGANRFYEHTSQLLQDLECYRKETGHTLGRTTSPVGSSEARLT